MKSKRCHVVLWTVLTIFLLIDPLRSANAQTANLNNQKLLQDLAQTTSYLCGGTEPFWNLTITPTEITFADSENKTTMSGSNPLEGQGLMPGFLRTYSTKNQDRQVTIVLKYTGNCSDGMSDTLYTHDATLIFIDKALSGCCQRK